MANPRLGHKKSRNGCQQCKKRRVKCDEQIPCSNCKRHGAECSLISCPPGSQNNRSVPRRQATILPNTFQSSDKFTEHSQADEYSNSSESSISGSSRCHSQCQSPAQQDLIQTSISSSPFLDFNFMLAEQPTCWIRDLELLHHYTTCTSLSIVSHERRVLVFQDSYPKLAFTHEYLMHGILALSALHLAYKFPDTRHSHMNTYMYHQNIAVTDFQATLSDITAENCHALVALGSLLAIMPFASASYQHTTDVVTIDLIDVAQSFNLAQGMTYILHSPHAAGNVPRGPLAPLLAHGPPISTDSLTGLFADELNKLDSINTSGVLSCVLIPTAPLACTLAIATLRKTYASICTDDSRREIAVWLWPAQVPPQFVTLIDHKHPIALLILANFAAMSHQLDEMWFMRGWGRAVLVAIAEAIHPNARIWLEEPMRWVRDGISIL